LIISGGLLLWLAARLRAPESDFVG